VDVSYEKNEGQFEAEGNNTREAANTVVEFGKPVEGNLHNYADTDFFKLALSKAGRVVVRFAHGNTENSTEEWIVTVFDPQENIYSKIASNGKETTTLSGNLYLPAGEYHVRVQSGGSFFWSAESYRLTVDFEENTGRFETERNDSMAAASPIPGAGAAVSGNLYAATDVDYYSFAVPTAGEYSVSFAHGNTENTARTWKVSLRDGKEAELAYLESSGTDTSLATKPVALEPGTYYVRVACYMNMYYNAADYNITVVTQGGDSSASASVNDPVVPKGNGTGGVSGASAEGVIVVLVNGAAVEFDQPPILENNRTLVPMRAIFEALGATVEWEGETMTITSTKGATVIVMQVGNPQMTVDGAAVTLDVPPKLVGDRTLVPVRAVAESFNATVGWDDPTQTVTVDTSTAG